MTIYIYILRRKYLLWLHVAITTCMTVFQQFCFALKIMFTVTSVIKKCLSVCMSVTSFASMTVPTPTVSAPFGTLLTSPPKNLALACIVSTASVLTRVLDCNDDPGSLKAI